jgi:hypothetical protein
MNLMMREETKKGKCAAGAGSGREDRRDPRDIDVL